MKAHPALIVAVGVVFTAFSAILIRLSDAPPLVIATYRMGFTSVLLTPLFLRERLSRRPQQPEPAGPPAGEAPAREVPRQALLLSVLSGLFLAAHFASWISSLSHTTVASATVLVTTHPLMVAVLGLIFLGERVGVKGALWMIGAVGGGVVLVAGDLGGGETSTYGNLLALGGALTVSVYIIIGRYARRYLTVNAYTMLVYWTAFLTLLLVTVMAGEPLWPYPAREFVLFAALAVFCTLLGHSLFNWALEFLPTTVVSTSILGEPIIATLLAMMIFAEIPSAWTVSGGVIILASISLFVREHNAAERSRKLTGAPRL